MPFYSPMLASLAAAPLVDPKLVYEPKYDGIRVIAEVAAGGERRQPPVKLWSRAGNEKTAQFPEIAAALEDWARRLKDPVVLDGEIVAVDDRGRPIGFQHLQSRIHLAGGRTRATKSRRRSQQNETAPPANVAFIAFDVLRVGETDVRPLPLLERRARLERLIPRRRSGVPALRISEMVRGDGRALHARALDQGWEGLIAKRADSPYLSGKRTPDWRKLKITLEQEFVIGGWTEPRGTRSHIGALLLGVYDKEGSRGSGPRATGTGRRATGAGRQASKSALAYVGHTGTGFDERELARLIALLRPIETDVCPFRERPPANERPHWVRPELVAEVRFSEWTSDGVLRQPVYLGLRDDKKPKEVHREADTRVGRPNPPAANAGDVETLLDQLRSIEDSRRDGVLHLPDGSQLSVTNLNKVFWPQHKLTKGDLFRYYVQVAAALLPVIADRPLVMKRFPNGIAAKPFYQHRVLEAPAGVRVESVGTGTHDVRPQIIGGSLLTLLYTTQLAAISQDPWFSRVASLEAADQVALDLDPMPGVRFARVLEVAQWIRDELNTLGAVGFPKTSGADGLHIYIPLPRGTPYEAGLLFCQIIAAMVASRHPKYATVERRIAARGDGRVYVDCLQNVLGRTLASAYSARASEWAGVSTPLSWQEVDLGVRREDFTIVSVPARLREMGDLWAALRQAKGVDSRARRAAQSAHSGTGSSRHHPDRSGALRRRYSPARTRVAKSFDFSFWRAMRSLVVLATHHSHRAGFVPGGIRYMRAGVAPLLWIAATIHAVFIYRTAFIVDGQTSFSLFDDAMVSMTYGRNLAQGYGLRWNAGEPAVEGYTNFLWTLWMAALHGVGAPDRLVSLLVMISSSAILLTLIAGTFSLAMSVTNDRRVSMSAAALTMLSYPLTYWSLRGMEVGLVALLIVLMLKGYLDWAARPRPASVIVWGSAMTLLLLTRTETIVPVVTLAIWNLLGGRRAVVATAWILAVAVTVLGAHSCFRWAYYGDVLPNTYYLKMTGVSLGTRIERGGKFLGFAIAAYLSPYLLPLLTKTFRGVLGRVTSPLWLFVAVVGAQFIYSVYVGADAWEWTMFANRYIAAVVPLMAILTSVAVWTLARTMSIGRCVWLATSLAIPPLIVHLSRRTLATDRATFESLLPTTTAVGLVSVLAAAWWLWRANPQRGAPQRTQGEAIAVAVAILASVAVVAEGPAWVVWGRNAGYRVEVDSNLSELGMRLQAATDADVVLGVNWAGAIPYFARRKAVDFLGKSDRVIARRVPVGDFLPGHNKFDAAHSIGVLQPDVIYPSGGNTEADVLIRALKYEPRNLKTGGGEETVFVAPRARSKVRLEAGLPQTRRR